jgi:hypothetical protein
MLWIPKVYYGVRKNPPLVPEPDKPIPHLHPSSLKYILMLPSRKFHIHLPLLRSFCINRASPTPCAIFGSMLEFFGKQLLPPPSTLKKKDHPLSALRDCLFSVFEDPQPEDAQRRGDNRHHLSQNIYSEEDVVSMYNYTCGIWINCECLNTFCRAKK